ncbi:hypothetical protein [Pseudoduganella violacea]|uniref:Uncharacterized protein n=1 Tax=Pseudoduganella violacea TaxID=1715466 RepID=A0A7W5FTN7_9BURK|nr:hypothetical protein [Pseudoduganella violacea]MBB3118373.1 hypothetical protein [Pseudoduganella violacea]
MSAATITSITLATAMTAYELFSAAFSVPRDPRSPAYKQGVLAALKFRIEGRRILKPYEAGTAEDDAYYAGIAEGHAIWRRTQAESAGAA